MARLTKEQLLSVKLPEKDVDMPELGGTVRIRALRASEQSKLFDPKAGGLDLEASKNLAAKVLTLSLIDPALTEEELASVFDNMPIGSINRLVAEVMELSGLGLDESKNS
jgi:hypothetical protein